MKNSQTSNKENVPVYVRYCEKHDWYYALSEAEDSIGKRCPICSGELVPTVKFLSERKLNFEKGESIQYIR